MDDVLQKCAVCGALVDSEDLFCANCGVEVAEKKSAPAAASGKLSTYNFECQGCGASMSYDASAGTLRCPFCGSERLERKNDCAALAPNRVVPFRLDRRAATACMRKWLGRGFWRPGDLARAATVTKMQPVYVPYWVFQASTFTYWTADSSVTPAFARASWYPVAGENRSSYSGLLVGASSVLSPAETNAVCPYDLAAAVAPDQVDLENATYEQFRVPRKYARPLARQGIEALERHACANHVPGRCRNLNVNVLLHDLAGEPVLLPVWIVAYRYGEQVYRFVVNGQSGRATGQAPFSWAKLWIGVAVAVLILVLLVLGSLILNG